MIIELLDESGTVTQVLENVQSFQLVREQEFGCENSFSYGLDVYYENMNNTQYGPIHEINVKSE